MAAALRAAAVALPACARALPRATASATALPTWQAVRHMGIFDSIQKGYEDRKEAQQQEQVSKLWNAQMEYMLSLKTYDMAAHIVSLKDTAKISGMDGWQKYLRTKQEQQEIEQKMKDVTIAEAFTEEEIANPALIDRKAKQRIAEAAGMNVQAVNKFLTSYEQAVSTCRWLKKRVAKGKAVPSSPAEYYNMMLEDPSGADSRQMRRMMPRRRGGRLG